MNINNYKNLYNQLIETDSQQKVKQLDQTERKEVLVALKALQIGDASTLSAHSDQIEPIVKKLEKLPTSTAIPTRSNIILRLFKGMMNLIYRTSSGSILSEAAKVTTMKEELARIPRSIDSNKKKIEEWIEMIRFNKEEAAPLYRSIVDFYQGLPRNLEEARPLLLKKYEEFSQKLSDAKSQKKDTGYIKILEREILESLRKLKKYEGEHFERELTGNINAFNNAYNMATDTGIEVLARQEIEKLRGEIEFLQKRKNELEQQPVGKLI